MKVRIAVTPDGCTHVVKDGRTLCGFFAATDNGDTITLTSVRRHMFMICEAKEVDISELGGQGMCADCYRELGDETTDS